MRNRMVLLVRLSNEFSEEEKEVKTEFIKFTNMEEDESAGKIKSKKILHGSFYLKSYAK